ncbi:hypothetical protein [Formosa algae]|uniref:hypothetical protein n=1 Tax=Formosa algae TaxID=225843 RepID=UPI000CCF680B|nr:hypothetical protein [Formosa algae]PNW30229.1 hypothetical protein BKP44_00860 [Formosa algae]
MKKILYVLFLLVGVNGIANNSILKVNVINTFEEVKINKIIPVELEELPCSVLYIVKRADGTLMHEFTLEAPDGYEDCGGVVFYIL